MASAEERAQARREAAHRRRREEEDARAAERHAEALSGTRAALGETPPKTAQSAPVKPYGRRKKKRPTRRTLSVKGTTYARLKAYCEANGLACSGVCEMLLNDYLDAQGHPKWEGQLPHVEERRRMEQAARDAASGVFTF